MAQQHILWTALPHGYAESGRGSGPLRLSIVVSPRLTPQTAAEQRLGAPGFADFHNWPKTLSGLQLGVRIGNQTVPVKLISQPDPKLWETLLGPDTPVNGFEFQDMSRVNLRSFPVRHVLGFLREHYGNLAQQSATTHPTLLPWRQAHPGLKTMLGELGTRTHVTNFGSGQVETPLPGFDRFFGRQNEEAIEALLDRQVFSEQGKYQTSVVGLDGQTDPKKKFAVRVLPSDWQDPALGRPDAAVMSQFRSQAEYSFYQANRFYRRRPATEAEQRMRRPNFQGVPPAPKPPEYDFHRIIASYADTPQVLRALGLIIDVVLPKGNPIEAQLKLQAQVDGVLGVEIISWPGHNLNNDSYPRTAWRATKQRFVTRSRTNEHAHGLLALEGAHDPTLGSGKSRSPFSVFQLDTDGAALKTVDYLLTAQNLIGKSLKTGSHGEVTYTTGDKQPVAALRGGGLGVAQHGRAAAVAMGAAAAALKNAAVTTSATESRKVVLFSEDVHRGHRVDVQANGKWHSLCARVGQYTVLRDGQPLDFKPDEGYVKGASTTGDGSDDHYLHESLFRWTGWSLVAPRPGRTIKSVEEADSGLQGESVQTVDEAAKTGNGLSVSFKAQPGTLPRLRFGWSYRFRARLTDLAGNSLAVNDPSLGDIEQATEAVPYLRFEPVDRPPWCTRTASAKANRWSAWSSAATPTPLPRLTSRRLISSSPRSTRPRLISSTRPRANDTSCRPSHRNCNANSTACWTTLLAAAIRHASRRPTKWPPAKRARCTTTCQAARSSWSPRPRWLPRPRPKPCHRSCPMPITPQASAWWAVSTSCTAKSGWTPPTCPMAQRAAWPSVV